MKQPKKTSRSYFDLDDKLDQIFAIDRIAVIESNEEEPPCPVFETYGELVEFYQRLVGRRITVREFLADKNDDQAVEKELQHLRNIIGSFTDRIPETIDSEERFGQLVPVREQKKVWAAVFADFPGLLLFDNWNSFIKLLLFMFFGYSILIGLLSGVFPMLIPIFKFTGIVFILIFVAFILLQLFYFRPCCRVRHSTLRTIAEKTVEAKKQFADYPISTVEEVEPMIRQTFSDVFLVPSDLLKQETRLDLELGFEL
ncbi:MAG: hypothetical protein LBG58_04245 [Planctomycetaceae bacterium]|jgi:uncharacterized membrane protein|nr:hypothetical protein [Planctomycetaceae bacterium]